MLKRCQATNNSAQGEATVKIQRLVQHPLQFITAYSIRPFANCTLYLLAIMAISITLFACATNTSNTTTSETEPQKNIPIDTTMKTDVAATPAATQPEAKPATAEKAAAPKSRPQQPESPRAVASCQNEPYVGYEQQARKSIQKGLEATQAEKFGVGFRNVEEHQKWSATHNVLFNETASACEALSKCTKANKNNNSKCAKQAQTFQDWQAITKNFTTKAKTAETTQPPKICSLKPSLIDAPRCFHQRAENILRDCDTEECKALSHCWDGVGYLDGVITQATQSCGFVHQELTQCRSYQEATKRRENKFSQCGELQNQFNITTYPIL